uniref:DNA 5'-3' helicase n=1 Tax=Leptosiphonia brodiei TaxID=2608611 RepID=A0A1Z1MA71_9FLOR|nr:Replication helicase subunit [Leptosiphonia brodiei]ARW62987.1 Replication helicase subunit [Leptosiphonia brodiei]
MHNFYRYKFIPQNYLAEEVLLGIILIYPKIINQTRNLITNDIFFIEVHKILYSKVNSIINNSDNSIIKLLYEIEKTNLHCTVNGIEYMIQLMKKSQIFISCCETNNYLENLIKLLQANYIKRLIIQLGHNIITLGYNINIKNSHLYTKLSYYVKNIEKEINHNKNNEITNIKTFISNEILDFKYINTKETNQAKEISITSGLVHLDKIIQCLPPGNLIIIAGRPSIGKTSLSINIAYNCFLKEKISLLVFSLEMTSDQIFKKFITIDSKINIGKESIETIYNKNWEKISKICNRLLEQNIYINEEPKLNIDQIEFIAHNLAKNQFIKLIIIDYLQLIELNIDKKVNNNRNQEVGYITRRLKLLAQYLKIPIITISQLNRNIENRQQKEPILSDLKESGCIIYNNNISLNKKNLSTANISKNIIPLRKKFEQDINQSSNILKYNNHEISILNKKTFKYINDQIILGLTYNHKFLTTIHWIKSTQISKINHIFSNINLNYSIKLKEYVNLVKFDKETKTYDVNNYNYFNFSTDKTTLHNSIEQDADIIMMLYEIDNTKYHNGITKTKTIDLKISKNRNGNTGSCKLTFEPYTNIFKDLIIENSIEN